MFRVEQAHNDYLQMLADGGILAAACVVVFVFVLLRKGIAAVGDHRDGMRRSIITGAMAGCLGILIHSFFDFPLRTPANGFFFLRNANTGGAADMVFGYGPAGAGWRPLAGDWDGQ